MSTQPLPVPSSLQPCFQEYDLVDLRLHRDANLIIQLATGPEIGTMKLAAIINRGTRKNFVDLYYLLQVVSLENIFEEAAVKYARVRSFPVSAMRALAYFADAEALPMPRMLE